MLLFLSAALLSCSLLFAQVPLLGADLEQNPSSLTWKKIDTLHFEIIFPQEIESDAQRVANLLEVAYPLVTRSLETLPPRISLILQNQSTISNGFVTLAPRRTEWYVTPAVDPELSNTEWLKTLSIHEFRHVVQFQKTRQGINPVFEIFLGEIGQALGLGLTLPPWFLEGDAVGVETALTQGGRGRLPMFERDLKAILLSGKDYDFDKATLGSYQDYLPNHYVYGYFYTSFMRNRHGDLFLSKLANRSAAGSYNPLSIYNAYEDLTKEDFNEFYRKTMKELISDWKKKEAELILTPYEVKNLVDKKGWTNYLFPQAVGKDTYLALKKGLSDISQFVLTDGKDEKTILFPGPLQNEYPIKVRGGRFAFVESEIDPRWGYRDFSRIRVFDLKKKKYVSDVRKTKARMAVLDQGGEHILYVNWDEEQGQQIIVRSLEGKELYRLSYPKERVITSLDWLALNEIVMVIKDHQDRKEIVKLTLLEQAEQSLLAPSTTNHGFVTTHEGRVLVESPQSGIDNIFELKNHELHQLTSSRFGAYAPQIVNHELVYNDYSAQGMQIAKKKLPWEQEQVSSNSFVPYYEKFAVSENQGRESGDFFKNEVYPVSPYSQFKRSINLHSWVILAPPLSSTVTVMGISRDLLNKFALTAGGSYDLVERELSGFTSATWTHLYPVLDLSGGYAGRKREIRIGGIKTTDQWEEGTFEGGIEIPWRRLSGRFTQSFSVRGFAKIIKVTNRISTDSAEVNDGALYSPGAEFQYSLLARMAPRDLNSPWGVSVAGRMEEGRDITGGDQRGSQRLADSRLYLPGIFKHHSFYHQVAYEHQENKLYQYPSYVFRPRGTRSFFLQEMTKYSGNYMFPLLTPDWHLSRYLYLKRLSLNLFYDDMKGRYRNYEYRATSTGWEMLFETHLLRLFVPVTLGVRGSYVIEGDTRNNYEIFLSTLAGTF